MVKLNESKGRYSITVPKDYVRLKGWQKGQELVIAVNDKNELVLKELKSAA